MDAINDNFVGPERSLMVAATLMKRYAKRRIGEMNVLERRYP